MTTKTFPIIIDSWSEYERGWGSRPDGISIHLSTADHKAFIQDFNTKHNAQASVPDEYTAADNTPRLIDVPESLYQRLVALKAQGKPGMFAATRKDEEAILAGRDPYTASALQNYLVTMTVEARGWRSAEEVEARMRQRFEDDGYKVVRVKATPAE